MNTIEKNVLYYPTIEIADTRWIRTALCIWDNVYRIVPKGYEPKDCDDAKHLIDKGLLHDIHLTKDDLDKTSKEYLKFMKKVPFLPSAAEEKSNAYINLHKNKLDVKIMKHFKDLSKGDKKNNFFKVPREQATLYMLFLAETVANGRNMAKITDSRDMYTAIQYFQQKGIFEAGNLLNSSQDEKLLSLILPIIMPQDIANIKIEKLVKIRNKNQENRRNFRDSLETFTKDLSSCKIKDEKYLIECAERFRNEQLAVHKDIKEFLFNNSFEIVSGFCYTTIPVFIANHLRAPDEIIKTIGLTLTATLPAAAKSIRKKWKSNCANYLVEMSDSVKEF